MKEGNYDEGKEISPNELMQLAMKKYKVLVEKGTWNTLSSSEEKIIALEAKIKALTDVKSLNKKGKRKGTYGSKGDKKKKTQAKREWLTLPPKAGEENKQKVVNKKYYHWCPTHKSWTRHTPKECKGLGSM